MPEIVKAEILDFRSSDRAVERDLDVGDLASREPAIEVYKDGGWPPVLA